MLARLVKTSGQRLRFRYGADAVRTRMYRNWSQMKEGWTKNLALLFVSPTRLATLRFAEFTLIVGSVKLALFAGNQAGLSMTAGTLGVLLYLLFLKRVARAQFDWRSTALALLGLPIFSYLLLRSRIAHRKGAVVWKGRTYDSISSAGSSPELPLTTKITDVSV